MMINQVFIVTEANCEPAQKLWYQDVAQKLQEIFDVKSFLIDLTEVATKEAFDAQKLEFELITRSLRDPFLIISHGVGSAMVIQSHVLTKVPHIMIAPYLYHSSDHTYEEKNSMFGIEAFAWDMLEKFTDTFLIELSNDPSIEKISHKEAGSLRTLHFHNVPYDGHAAMSGSHNNDIPDLTAEILRIMVQRGYAKENEQFVAFKKELSNNPLHITPALEIETLTKELSYITGESSPGKIALLLREAREKEKFYTLFEQSKKDKIDKQLSILIVFFGIVAIMVLFLTDTVSLINPKPVTVQSGIYLKAPVLELVKNSNKIVMFEPSAGEAELLLRKIYLNNQGIQESTRVAAGIEDLYIIQAPKQPRGILFTVTDASSYLTYQNQIMAEFLRLPANQKITATLLIDEQVFEYKIDETKTLYSVCISKTQCGISYDKNFLTTLKEQEI